ncbi:DNA-processing protein DprA [Bacteroidota bacterium]
MMKKDDLLNMIALQMVPLVGPKLAKILIAYCGGPEAVFYEKRKSLEKIPGIGRKIADSLLTFKDFERAEQEIEFTEKHNIQIRSYLGRNYPERLRHIDDAPLLLFSKGNCDLNYNRMIAIVGTRNATDYGKEMCKKLIDELKVYNPLIVSGLAFGIDHCAHKHALANELETVAVLGHGLDTIYPGQHRSIAKEISNHGCLLTEYVSGTKPDKMNFPERNRIVAGMVDGLVVVESGLKGGALITADIAFSYNREVFALPGRTSDDYSSGCNRFIKLNKAALVENANDIAYALGWDLKTAEVNVKKPSLLELDDAELKLVELLGQNGKVHIDQISPQAGLNNSELSYHLLDLEFRGYIKAYPGNYYKKI